jgi:hypothetical protein
MLRLQGLDHNWTLENKVAGKIAVVDTATSPQCRERECWRPCIMEAGAMDLPSKLRRTIAVCSGLFLFSSSSGYIMQQIPYRSSSSLLTRILGGLITIKALVIGLTVGFALFLVILGLAAIAFVAFYARIYWVRRKLMQRMQQAQQQRQWQEQGHRVIEGEYHVERSRERR